MKLISHILQQRTIRLWYIMCIAYNFFQNWINHGESYTIMPTTFGESKVGSFVLSILSEFEFAITKDKTA
jgi:hypothetical protein